MASRAQKNRPLEPEDWPLQTRSSTSSWVTANSLSERDTSASTPQQPQLPPPAYTGQGQPDIKAEAPPYAVANTPLSSPPATHHRNLQEESWPLPTFPLPSPVQPPAAELPRHGMHQPTPAEEQALNIELPNPARPKKPRMIKAIVWCLLDITFASGIPVNRRQQAILAQERRLRFEPGKLVILRSKVHTGVAIVCLLLLLGFCGMWVGALVDYCLEDGN